MNRILVIAFALMLGAGLSLPAAAQADGGRPSREELKKKFDKNADGKLDQSERQALREAMKKRLGREGRADRPGRGARSEARRGQGPGRRAAFARRLRAVLDRNGDGKIGPVERRLALRVLRRMGMRGGQEGPGATPRRLGRQNAPGRVEGRRPGPRRQAGTQPRLGRDAGIGGGPGFRAGAQPRLGRQAGARRGPGLRDGSGLGQGRRGPGRNAANCQGRCPLIGPSKSE